MDFTAAVVAWYKEHGRELPWRGTRDPYLIWISEIILQQTRVAQGLAYFRRFVERFPDVRALAAAEEDEVMRCWQGLGYYSRARNLHAAAREIVERHGGEFPQDYAEVLALKGVGEYTAAAICSFAWGMPRAVVDGNVYRVLARFFGIATPIDTGRGKREFAELAQELLDKREPDVYNQAMMDFGAVQCTPQAPACLVCPLRDGCRALAEGRVAELPAKQGRTEVKPRYFNYLDVHCGGVHLLRRREGKDIWRNLYEFPLVETAEAVDWLVLEQGEAYRRLVAGAGTVAVRRMTEMPRHVLSHRVIYARVYDLEVERFGEGMADYVQVAEGDEGRYAVPRLVELYWERVAGE